MGKKIKSLSRTILLIIVPMLVCMILFVICTIVSLRNYKKDVTVYTNTYYKYAVFSEEVEQLWEAYQLYNSDGCNANYMQLNSSLADTKRLFEKVYEDKINMSPSGQYYAENISVILNGMENIMLGVIKPELSEVEDKINLINTYVFYINREQIINNTENDFGKKDINLCYVFMVLSIICVIALGFLLVIFIFKRVSKPIKDIYEWSVAFEDGYCGMEDLEYDREDEIGCLTKSFNIVKSNLKEAHKLKEANEDVLRRLQSEEDNKKKFVQQLYVEKKEKENLSSIAMHDGLTGLYNRNAFDQIVREFLKKRKDGHEGAFFLIDMDYFKNVNDTLGHLMGDEALKTLANTMRDVFGNASLGRYGGDEFIVFMSSFNDIKDIETLAAGLCKKMRIQMTNEGKTVSLSVSIGATTTVGINDFSELYRKADKSLYISKETGKDRFTISE